ncbi:MAG TPA: DUF4249 domain-containing protein, partial [Mucilaginibacter sp.]
VTFVACRKPYTPSVISTTDSYLVVEGVINSGSDSTIISLSRTVPLSVNSDPIAELNAQVTIEPENGGGSYPLYEFSAGKYATAGLNLDVTKKYRLHIMVAGSEYASDYMPVKKTPPIDSISYKISSKGLQINANTHDPANGTRYYRWAYEESWRFHSRYNSGLIVKNGAIVARSAGEMVYYCYAGDRSSNIILASSSKLTQDVISEAPVTIIPPTSEKLGIKYSILLKQYALTKEEYAFWENMKKNSEQLGSIFDPQPSQNNGNIHNLTHPDQPAIGFISITNVQTKRIFLDSSLFPADWGPLNDPSCGVDSALYNDPKTGRDEVQNKIIRGGLIPMATISPDGYHIIGYTASSVYCIDCTLRGKVEAPPFWQ